MTRFISALLCATFASLFYVYAEVEAVRIGYQIREQEEKRVQLLDRTRTLKYNNARLKAPGNLQKKLLSQHTVLDTPRSWQTLVVKSGQPVKKPDWMPLAAGRPSWLGKVFVGTAQAEAKESVAD